MARMREVAGARYDWRAGLLAGIIAGLVFLVVEMALAPAVGANVFTPVRMIGAIALGPDVLPPPATFDLGVLIAAMVVHFVLAAAYAALLGLFVRRQRPFVAALVGAGFGLILYLVNFFIFTGIFPWFALARNWVTVLAHLSFGIAAGLSYIWIAHRVTGGEPAQTPV